MFNNIEHSITIRWVNLADLEELIRIEQENFSPAEAASPQAMKERLEKIADSFLVAVAYQGQGIGSLLLAALKELAVRQKRQGISLTCHDELISYYEMNGFVNEGLSQSTHGGATWYDLVWDNPYLER